MITLKCFGYFRLKEQQAQGNEMKPCFDISGTFYWCEPARFEDRLLVRCLFLTFFFNYCDRVNRLFRGPHSYVPWHQVTKFPTSETLGEVGTSYVRSDFWDRLGGQALVMIGQLYSRQPLTNHK